MTKHILLALLLAGCGSSESNFQPAQAQATSLTSPSIAGNWGGYFDGTQRSGIELELTQSGTSLEGHGAVFRDDNPQPVFVVGLIAADGSFQLDLFPVDVAAAQSMQLVGRLTGTQATASFSTDDDPNPTAVSLAQDQAAVTPLAAAYDIRLKANATGQEYRITVTGDQWTSDGSFGTTAAQTNAGTVTGGSIPFFPGWAQLDLHPAQAQTFNNVAHLLFRGDGRQLDPDSGVQLPGKCRSYVTGTI